MKFMSVIKLPAKTPVKLESLEKFMAMAAQDLKKLGLVSPKDFGAGVLVDEKGSPRGFVFDTYSLWDLLCAMDEKYEESASAKKYVFKNPVGWLIDAIEAHLPINPKLAQKLKKGIEEAEKLGYIPFEKMQRELGLA